MQIAKRALGKVSRGQIWKHKRRGSRVYVSKSLGDNVWAIQRISSNIVHRTTAKDLLINYELVA